MKIIRWLDEHLEEFLLTLLLIGISTVVIAQVAARSFYAVNPQASPWADYSASSSAKVMLTLAETACFEAITWVPAPASSATAFLA